jgi:formate dehydrogenase assembly factor FdhD
LRLRNVSFFVKKKVKNQQKQITKTGCACCGRETTKKGNREKKEKRTVMKPESD